MQKVNARLTAPDVNRLAARYSHGFQNPERPSAALMEDIDPLFKTMEDLAPSEKNGSFIFRGE